MKSSVRTGSAVLALLAAGGTLGACGSSGSTGSSAAAPRVGSAPVTLHYFSKSTSQGLFGADGKPITDPNAAPQPGDYILSTGVDYVGDHSHHASAATGSDHLLCVFETVASTPSGSSTVLCDGEVALGGSMLLADHQTIQLSQTSPINLSFTGGTGQYQGVTGTIRTRSVGANSNDTDFTITISK